MSRIRDAWRMVEQQRPPHKGALKGNGSGADTPPVTADAEPILMPLTSDAPAQNHGYADGDWEQYPSTNWQPDARSMLFFGSEEQGNGKEDFRTLRSRLYQMREKTALKRILVTSSLPREGRSFVAANLAQVLARQQNCRALLIDADLRSPALHLALGTSATPGLSEYLLGETEELAIIQRGQQIKNLFFIASGRPVSEQSEIVSNGRLQELLDRLAEAFDWIIVDSPAALPVSDAGLIAGHCDGVLMVVRSNSTPFDIVRKARERFREEQLLGVVLNGVPESHQSHYNGASHTKSKPNGKWE